MVGFNLRQLFLALVPGRRGTFAAALASGRNALPRGWLLLLGVLCLVGARYHAVSPIDSVNRDTHVATYNGQDDVRLTGLVSGEPKLDDTRINLRLQAETIQLPDGEQQPVSGLVLIEAPRYPIIGYGTRRILSSCVNLIWLLPAESSLTSSA